MSRSIEDRVAALAARRHGVVTRSQLFAVGMTRRGVESRLKSGRLIPQHRGVYLVGGLQGSLEPRRAREMAAVLACGPDAALSHRSAGCLWELHARPRAGAPVDVTVPGRARLRRSEINIHRSGDLGESEITVREGIPVTTPGRTLRDLSAVVSARELGRAVSRAKRHGLIDGEALAALADRHRGRPGAPLLRAVLEHERAPAYTRSEAEERFLELVRSGGLPEPETNVLVQGREVDFLWREANLAVEVDGYEFHRSRRAFENDRRRDAELAGVGVHAIRFTWRHIVEESHETLVRLAQALALRAPRRVAGPSAMPLPGWRGSDTS